MTVEEMMEFLVTMEIATEEEISLVTAINGWNEETMEDILYVRRGYHCFEQIKEDYYD